MSLRKINYLKKDTKLTKNVNLVVDLFVYFLDSAVGSRFHKNAQFYTAGNEIPFKLGSDTQSLKLNEGTSMFISFYDYDSKIKYLVIRLMPTATR